MLPQRAHITFSRRQGSDVGSTSFRNCKTFSGVCRTDDGGYTSDEQSETSIFRRRARDNGKNTRALQSLSFRFSRFGMCFMMSSGNFSMLVPLRFSECTLFPTHFPDVCQSQRESTDGKTEKKHYVQREDSRVTCKRRYHTIYGCSVKRVGRHIKIIQVRELQNVVANDVHVCVFNACTRNAQNLDFRYLTFCKRVISILYNNAH